MIIKIVRLLVTLLFVPLQLAQAQQPKKFSLIGILESGSPTSSSERIKAFRQGLRELDYVEGQNISIEYRYAEGSTARFAEFSTELARLKVDVIVTASTPGVQAANRASSTIAIVFASINDPVASGLVDSLAARWEHHRADKPFPSFGRETLGATEGNFLHG